MWKSTRSKTKSESELSESESEHSESETYMVYIHGIYSILYTPETPVFITVMRVMRVGNVISWTMKYNFGVDNDDDDDANH